VNIIQEMRYGSAVGKAQQNAVDSTAFFVNGGAMTYTIPGGVRTLAAAPPATWVVVRSVLGDGARDLLQQHRVCPGDPLRSLDANSAGIVIETISGRRVLLPWEDAGTVQVENLGAEDADVLLNRDRVLRDDELSAEQREGVTDWR
jgi:hypothetical protein